MTIDRDTLTIHDLPVREDQPPSGTVKPYVGGSVDHCPGDTLHAGSSANRANRQFAQVTQKKPKLKKLGLFVLLCRLWLLYPQLR
jgi:hypothetical protein